jgi:hypothetical protein
MSTLELKVTHWGHVKLDKKEVRALMRAAGTDVKNKTRRLISQKAGSGRRYRKNYKASAPGNPPIQHTGALRDSLKVYTYKSGEGFTVRELQFYSLFLTIGGRGGGRAPGGGKGKRRHRRGMKQPSFIGQRVFLPRPHLDRVIAEQAPEIDRRVREALEKGLKWQETK